MSHYSATVVKIVFFDGHQLLEFSSAYLRLFLVFFSGSISFEFIFFLDLPTVVLHVAHERISLVSISFKSVSAIWKIVLFSVSRNIDRDSTVGPESFHVVFVFSSIVFPFFFPFDLPIDEQNPVCTHSANERVGLLKFRNQSKTIQSKQCNYGNIPSQNVPLRYQVHCSSSLCYSG